MSELIETLRDALKFAVSYHYDVARVNPPDGWTEAFTLLSDRETLLWALLEEMAGEVTVRTISYDWVEYSRGGSSAVLRTDGKIFLDNLFVNKNDILCLARAIQEQKRREVPGG